MPDIFTLSMTELPQFGRLVEFVVEVNELAERNDDRELQDLVEELKSDLLFMPDSLTDRWSSYLRQVEQEARDDRLDTPD